MHFVYDGIEYVANVSTHGETVMVEHKYSGGYVLTLQKSDCGEYWYAESVDGTQESCYAEDEDMVETLRWAVGATTA